MDSKNQKGITVHLLGKIYTLPFATNDINHMNQLIQNIEGKMKSLQEALPNSEAETLLVMQLLLQEDIIEDYKNKNQENALINTISRLKKIEQKIQSVAKTINT